MAASSVGLILNINTPHMLHGYRRLAMHIWSSSAVCSGSIHPPVHRKKKLLKKQAAGKKRMKSLGKVDVPQEAFMALLSMDRTPGAGSEPKP